MIPNPRDILLRRIQIHRRRGEFDIAKTLWREMQRRDDTGDWSIPEDCAGELRSLVDLGFPLFACRFLEREGLVYAGDLCQWSEEQLRSILHIGTPRMLYKIRDVLASVGLKLRDSRPGEPPPRRRPLARWLEHRRHRLRRRRLSERRKRQIMYLVSQNISEREISRRLGYRSHTTVWAVKREMRGKVAEILTRNDCEASVQGGAGMAE
jgi:hypothetical protein